MEMEQSKREQIASIKNRLNTIIFDERRMTVYKLRKSIANSPNLYEVNYNTLANTLSLASSALDLLTVVAICRCLNLDTAYILSPPGTPDPGDAGRKASNAKFKMLDDPHYLGLFHGFLYTPNPEKRELIRFDLQLKWDEEKEPSAILTYYDNPVDVHNQVNPDTRIFYGIPYLDTLHSNVFIQFTNSQGDYYYFYYSRQALRSHNMYFRRGIAVTASWITTMDPMTQSFVMFALEVPNSKLHYIPGLLADVSPIFYVSDDDMRRLRSEYAVVDTFFQHFSHILEHDAALAFPINEENILTSNSADMSRDDIIRALLLLKGASTGLARHVYSEKDVYGSFSKTYLQQPD